MYINPNNALPNEPKVTQALALLLGIGKRESIRKGTIILKQGQMCDFLFLVEQGAFRAFRWIEDIEVTIGFSFSGDMDTCPYSFFNNLPSNDVIEALTDSVIVKINRDNLLRLAVSYPTIHDLMTYLLSHYVEVLVSRSLEHRILTAEEIYLKLLSRQPSEIAKIPLQYIASYLGISKERLSRIRKKHRS